MNPVNILMVDDQPGGCWSTRPCSGLGESHQGKQRARSAGIFLQDDIAVVLMDVNMWRWMASSWRE
jgi:hypothetical protein